MYPPEQKCDVTVICNFNKHFSSTSAYLSVDNYFLGNRNANWYWPRSKYSYAAIDIDLKTCRTLFLFSFANLIIIILNFLLALKLLLHFCSFYIYFFLAYNTLVHWSLFTLSTKCIIITYLQDRGAQRHAYLGRISCFVINKSELTKASKDLFADPMACTRGNSKPSTDCSFVVLFHRRLSRTFSNSRTFPPCSPPTWC